jgi:hypothetical protein
MLSLTSLLTAGKFYFQQPPPRTSNRAKTATANSRKIAGGKPVSIILSLHLPSVYPKEKPAMIAGCLHRLRRSALRLVPVLL